MSTFELPSARNLSLEKAVEKFVPTPLFWQMLESDSNDIVFGTRGSGKTMLLRMMSVPHLSRFAETDSRAKANLYQRRRFGIFLPMALDWCVAYRKHQDDAEQFIQGANIAACSAFVETLGTLLETVEHPTAEADVCDALVGQWLTEGVTCPPSLRALRQLLLRQEALFREVWRDGECPTAERYREVGFQLLRGSLFSPLVNGCKVVNQLLGLDGEHRWLLCLDELEVLTKPQVQALATVARANVSPLVLKITTQPYTFQSVETDFGEVASAVDFRDFESKRLQYDPQDKEYKDLVAGILGKRLKRDPAGLGEEIFGKGGIVRNAENLEEFKKAKAQVESNFDAGAARKLLPVVAVRCLRRAQKGNANSIAYSGWDVIVRLSDGNPGVFVRLMNRFDVGPETMSIPRERQDRIAREQATSWLEWSQAICRDGAYLHEMLMNWGRNFSSRLHDQSLDDARLHEETNRVEIDLQSVSQRLAEALRVGARHSLVVAETVDKRVRYPMGKGVWRLSYSLAPEFWLIPRRGRRGALREGGTVKQEQLLFAFEGDEQTLSGALSGEEDD